MNDKLKQLIKEGCEYWSVDELKDLMEDIEEGGENVRDAISELISELEDDEINVCAVCGDKVHNEAYVMLFGPSSFRKQANFCAVDCMEYFLGKLKSIHNKKDVVTGKQDYLE